MEPFELLPESPDDDEPPDELPDEPEEELDEELEDPEDPSEEDEEDEDPVLDFSPVEEADDSDFIAFFRASDG